MKPEEDNQFAKAPFSWRLRRMGVTETAESLLESVIVASFGGKWTSMSAEEKDAARTTIFSGVCETAIQQLSADAVRESLEYIAPLELTDRKARMEFRRTFAASYVERAARLHSLTRSAEEALMVINDDSRGIQIALDRVETLLDGLERGDGAAVEIIGAPRLNAQKKATIAANVQASWNRILSLFVQHGLGDEIRRHFGVRALNWDSSLAAMKEVAACFQKHRANLPMPVGQEIEKHLRRTIDRLDPLLAKEFAPQFSWEPQVPSWAHSS